jgi:CheY-like chemotaxis protein
MLPEAVGSAGEALDRMRACASRGGGYRVAIVDRQMPGSMDGASLAREIAADSSLKGTAVVMLTGMGNHAESAGVAAYQPKPVKRQALFDCLRGVLRGTAAADRKPNSAATGQPATSCCKGRILVAEDNPVNQRVARLQVERLGFAVDVVGNGEEALTALERLAYALVLMDCQMPGMDGYEATRALRLRENGSRRTPVIAMTANAFAADQQACLDAGMDDYLSKPVDLKVLREKLDHWAGVGTLR